MDSALLRPPMDDDVVPLDATDADDDVVGATGVLVVVDDTAAVAAVDEDVSFIILVIFLPRKTRVYYCQESVKKMCFLLINAPHNTTRDGTGLIIIII